MPAEDYLRQAEQRMQKAVEHMRNEFRTVRTGRASAGLVEHIKIDYYGTPTELRQLATITCPDPLMIVVKPYDPGSLQAIVKGLQVSDIGITPQSDGKVVRLQVPELSEERRKQLVHQLKELAEETRIKLRNIRRDVNKELDAAQKDKELSEDESKRGHDLATELVHTYEQQIDEALKTKTEEIMEV